MSVLLYCVGALAFVAGSVMVGFGIPVSEFSFGNTLISAGTTAAIGGLIVVGLGAAVAQLQRIVDTLSTPVPMRARPVDIFDPARGAPLPSRVPFPSKPPKDEAALREPRAAEPLAVMPPPVEAPPEEPADLSFAPALRNPDGPPVTVEDDVSLSPQQPTSAPAPEKLDEPSQASLDLDAAVARAEARSEDDWRPPARQSNSSYFDAMWPAEKPAARPAFVADVRPAPMPEPPPTEPEPVLHEEPEGAPAPEAGEARTVAILKSGVVDGMGYTLYVDGSIEAELPQGTLRFASINELRSHLEQNS